MCFEQMKMNALIVLSGVVFDTAYKNTGFLCCVQTFCGKFLFNLRTQVYALLLALEMVRRQRRQWQHDDPIPDL